MRPPVPAVSVTRLAALVAERGIGVQLRGEADVSGVSLDSRRITPGDLYAALPGGARHGAEFSVQAQASGAVAVLTDAAGAALVPPEVPLLTLDDARRGLAWVAAEVYGHPARSLATVGVTGTQGKTTTAQLIHALWQGTGTPAGVIGTLGALVGAERYPTGLTTPEAPDLQRLLAQMRDHEVRACVVEVSSHALELSRVDGVQFDVALFTNLGRDHLDFHPTTEAYFAAKAKLFTPERAKVAVINTADEYGRQLREQTTLEVVTYSAGDHPGDHRARGVVCTPSGCEFEWCLPDGDTYNAWVPLVGAFNVTNALAALAAVHTLGGAPEALIGALAQLPAVPGRLEQVGDDRLSVVVDYAHKPDAVAAVLDAVRPNARRVIVVLGAGGDRDTGKRPLMGEAAATRADIVIVTDDNPRSEDPAAIRAHVWAGAQKGTAQLIDCGDRRVAIATALELAHDGDVVVIAGKGHETGQEAHGVITPFDDRVVAREELARVRGTR